jgi:hypothetical protein
MLEQWLGGVPPASKGTVTTLRPRGAEGALQSANVAGVTTRQAVGGGWGERFQQAKARL